MHSLRSGDSSDHAPEVEAPLLHPVLPGGVHGHAGLKSPLDDIPTIAADPSVIPTFGSLARVSSWGSSTACEPVEALEASNTARDPSIAELSCLSCLTENCDASPTDGRLPSANTMMHEQDPNSNSVTTDSPLSNLSVHLNPLYLPSETAVDSSAVTACMQPHSRQESSLCTRHEVDSIAHASAVRPSVHETPDVVVSNDGSTSRLARIFEAEQQLAVIRAALENVRSTLHDRGGPNAAAAPASRAEHVRTAVEAINEGVSSNASRSLSPLTAVPQRGAAQTAGLPSIAPRNAPEAILPRTHAADSSIEACSNASAPVCVSHLAGMLGRDLESHCVWGWLEPKEGSSLQPVVLKGRGVVLGRSLEASWRDSEARGAGSAQSAATLADDACGAQQAEALEAEGFGFVEVSDGRVSRKHCVITAWQPGPAHVTDLAPLAKLQVGGLDN